MNTEETINAKRDAPSESAILVGLNNLQENELAIVASITSVQQRFFSVNVRKEHQHLNSPAWCTE